jgi:hypothetical protein
MINRSQHVRFCNSPEGLGQLSCPKVLGVVWTGAWSKATQKAVDRIVSRLEFNVAGADEMKWEAMPETAELKEHRALNKDMARFTGLFEQLGIDLLGRKNIRNMSRTEPGIGSDYTNAAAPWHADGGSLLMLGVPGGVTPEYIGEAVSGTFDEWSRFTPANPDLLESLATPITEDGLPAFKGAHFRNRTAPPGPGRVAG